MLKHELSKALSKRIVATTDECGKCVSDPFRALHGAPERAGKDGGPTESHDTPGSREHASRLVDARETKKLGLVIRELLFNKLTSILLESRNRITVGP